MSQVFSQSRNKKYTCEDVSASIQMYGLADFVNVKMTNCFEISKNTAMDIACVYIDGKEVFNGCLGELYTTDEYVIYRKNNQLFATILLVNETKHRDFQAKISFVSPHDAYSVIVGYPCWAEDTTLYDLPIIYPPENLNSAYRNDITMAIKLDELDCENILQKGDSTALINDRLLKWRFPEAKIYLVQKPATISTDSISIEINDSLIFKGNAKTINRYFFVTYIPIFNMRYFTYKITNYTLGISVEKKLPFVCEKFYIEYPNFRKQPVTLKVEESPKLEPIVWEYLETLDK